MWNPADPSAGTYHNFAGDDRFNYAPYNLLLTPSKRKSMFARVDFNITDDVSIYAKGLFNNRVSRNQAAPEPIFVGPYAGTGGLADTISISALNPYNPFGIDLDPGMVALARTNAARVRGRRCPIEIVEADATRFEVPDHVTCVFMYNPFGGEVLEGSLRRVLDSMDRRERRMRLIYGNPKEHDLVMELGRFRPSGSLSLGWRPGREWARTQRVQFYEVVRAPAPRPVAGR